MPSASDESVVRRQQRHSNSDLRVVARSLYRHGLVTTADLRQSGLDGAATLRRVRAGRLFPQYRGVYAVGRPDLTLEARFLAAVLALGEGATLSHLSAAVHWGFLPAKHSEARPIEVSLNRQVRARAGITAHRTKVEWTNREGIRTTTPAHTLRTLSAAVNRGILQRAINEALVQRRVSVPQLQVLTTNSPALRSALACRPSPTRSHLEDRALAYLRLHGFPHPQTNVRLKAGRRRFEVDIFYAQHDLVIEADSAEFHDTPQAQHRDREKQALLEAAGYRVLRLRWADTAPGNMLTAQRITAALGRHATAPPAQRA